MSNEVTKKRGTVNTLAVTALQSLANSATVGWKSAVIDDTAVGALDYEIMVKLPTANTAPAAPKSVYIYICPAYYDGSAFIYSDGGTATMPSSGDAGYTIAADNNLILLRTLNYTTQQQNIQHTMFLSERFATMPDGFLIIIVNNSGAALSTGCVVQVTPITQLIN